MSGDLSDFRIHLCWLCYIINSHDHYCLPVDIVNIASYVVSEQNITLLPIKIYSDDTFPSYIHINSIYIFLILEVLNLLFRKYYT